MERFHLIVAVVAGVAVGVALAVTRARPPEPVPVAQLTEEPVDAGPAPDAPPDGSVPHLGLPIGQVVNLGTKLAPLQLPRPPMEADDWLVRNPEWGQTFSQYVASHPNRPSAERTTIYVVALGDFEPAQVKVLDAVSEGLSTFFGVPVKRLAPLPLSVIPAESRRDPGPPYGEQILTDAVLEMLGQRRPPDALAVVALSANDLWPGGDWNFVFGQASLDDRVGVWSMVRLGNLQKNGPKVLRRTLQTALHETGHMMGILHCTFHACGMGGSNSLRESDRHPVQFCAEDEMKILWAFPVDPVKRYQALAEFARRQGLEEEAQFWAKSAEAVTP
jgi:archaemetzincin